jgi:hypothetical protein
MSAAQGESDLGEIDLEVLEAWLDNLPNAAEMRQKEALAQRAAGYLEDLSEHLTTASARLKSIQAGLARLGLPKFDPGGLWDNLQDSLEKLPKIEVRSLSSFAEGNGRTLPNQVERLTRAVDTHWRGECEKLAREIITPLRTVHGAMAGDPSISRPKTDALNLIIKRLTLARDAMVSEPKEAPTFLARQKDAQDYLARALSGAPDPGMLIRRLASGDLHLGTLDESDLEALRGSPLANAITLKL